MATLNEIHKSLCLDGQPKCAGILGHVACHSSGGRYAMQVCVDEPGMVIRMASEKTCPENTAVKITVGLEKIIDGTFQLVIKS